VVEGVVDVDRAGRQGKQAMKPSKKGPVQFAPNVDLAEAFRRIRTLARTGLQADDPDLARRHLQLIMAAVDNVFGIFSAD
jgi:hypothetical protein